MTPARQHTFAAFSLAVVEIALDELRTTLPNSCEKRQRAHAEKWLSACSAALPQPRESQGGKREESWLFNRLYAWMLTRQDSEEQRLVQAVRTLWLAVTLVVDTTALCAKFCETNREDWERLIGTLTTLGSRFLRRFPGVDEQGTEAYMQLLEGYDTTDV